MIQSQIKLDLDIENNKTLQDFRNELQEMSFKELHLMNINGNTVRSNLINGLLRKLDEEYGTEYQQTETTKKLLEENK